ncbi:glutathione S-transferase [Exidia glandulosa HHB12029]|uniref:Glutathione S-transferase n=1 Tax=Exidia glandulosa HHB12029 TaxID=1314781 RepID=A0A165EWD7_EXIGL|nr:glutathione S-transferase [Exidia glandulosa HHB12029]
MSHPDAVIHDRATGVAADTVAKHAEAQPLVFYAGWFCPFVQRSWIALEEKGVPYQYKEVNPYKKEPHFLAINPKGLVPSAEVHGKALYESLVLNEFFEDFFPDAPKLLPEDPVEKARARIWIDYIAKTIVPAFMRLVMAQDPAEQSKLLNDYYDALKKYAEQIAPGGPYFLGPKFSLVDATIAPWVVRDYIITEHRGYTRSAAGEAWEKYSQAIETRDSIVNTASEKQYYAQIYARYLKNEAMSEFAKALRQGKSF